MPEARWLRLAVVLLVVSPCVAAQNFADPNSLVTIRKDVNEVNLTFTVTDRKGRFVNGLKQENFSIFDDHQPPTSVKRFQSLTDLPLRICVVIDTSDSIGHYLKFQQEVAIRFLKDILRRGEDQACLVKFAATPVLAQDFTDDIGKLESGVRNVKSVGSTAVWDALHFTSRLMAETGTTDSIRRVIVLITDGEDNQSTTTYEQVTQDLLRSEVAVEAVDTYDTALSTPLLRKLGKTTGGHFWAGRNAKQLVASMQKIEQSLRSGYFVAYEPAGDMAPGRFRKIQVKPRNLRGKVAYRSGYFVPRREHPLADNLSNP